MSGSSNLVLHNVANIIKPPTNVAWDHRQSVFLAGTIDNGQGVDWQTDVEAALSDLDILILNPRREEWDSSWEQTMANARFREQVEWELDGLERASLIFMYFAPGSKSPITLLELGLHAASNRLIIVCPHGFWRRGNIEVVAHRHGIPLFENIDDGLSRLRNDLISSTTGLSSPLCYNAGEV